MIEIGRCGFSSKHPIGFRRVYEHPTTEYVLLLIHTPAHFRICGIDYKVQENCFVIFGIGEYPSYECPDAEYMDDWVHFRLTGEDQNLLSELQIPVNVPTFLPQMNSLSALFRQLVFSRFSDEYYKEPFMNNCMKAILYRLASLQRSSLAHLEGLPFYDEMLLLRARIKSNSNAVGSVSDLAATLNLSVSYFEHLYKRYFHISCMQDIILSKVERAEYYLLTTNYPVHYIAEFCGYQSTQHFIRQFKSIAGITPNQFRKNNKIPCTSLSTNTDTERI
nr:AraC family transcriptional regulator [Lachnospiraceae bacterium]